MSKLVLGTVQFGLDYGVTNQLGQVPKKNIRKILDFAKENGINSLDTAPAYGDSEKILGEIGVEDFDIISKTNSLNDGVNLVESKFQISLEKLGKKQLEGLLVHNINDIKNIHFDELYKMMFRLKKEGLVKKIGFSAYTPDQVDFLLANVDFDLIQLPFNVFDTRLIEGGQLKLLKTNNVEIHARTVFLQGVLLDFNSLSEYFIEWKDQFIDYQSMVRESGLSLLEYSLQFVMNMPEIDKVLVGVNSINQLKEIILAASTKNNVKAYPINDLSLVNPALWKL